MALRLIPLAFEELDNPDLVDRLLKHAESSAVDDLESGWVKFESLRYANSSIDDFVELAALAEKMSKGEPLAAAVLHHVGLLYLGVEQFDECQVFTTRSMRIRNRLKIKQV